MSQSLAHLGGWLDVPERHIVAAQFPRLMQAGPRLFGAYRGTDPVLLYKAWTEVLGGEPPYPAQQIGDCFVAGTMVLGETTKPIEQVAVGDMVWTGEGTLSKVVSTRTLQTMKPLVRIATKGGLPMTCTADHRVLAYRVPVVSGKRVTKPYYERCVNGGAKRTAVIEQYEAMQPEWVAAGELTSDHYLLSPTAYEAMPVPDDVLLRRLWEVPCSRRMLGYFVGDGSASGGSVEFTVSVKQTSDFLMADLEALGYRPVLSGYGKDCNAWRIRVHSKELVACLRRHFYDSDGVKVFPGWAIGNVEFADGLSEADGCNHGDSESISSTSLSVIYGMAASQRVFGYNPIVSKYVRSAGTYANAKPLYMVKWVKDRTKHTIWRDDDYVCYRVKSIGFVEGPATVYDIGVEDSHHSFIANGYAVHNCVSFGHAHANDLLQCIEISLGEPTDYKETDTEFIYATSREIAGILSNQDGSFGSAAVKAMTEWGVVSREMLGSDGAYDGHRAKSWGRDGAPQKIKDMAKPYLLGAAALVKTWDELVAAITSGYPVTICSDQGFTMTRDENGFCDAHGSWGHCMHLSGIRFDIEGACVDQSWGRNTPDGPQALGQPSFSFWAHRRTIEGILSQGDSWALSKSPDFAPRPLPTSWRYSCAA